MFADILSLIARLRTTHARMRGHEEQLRQVMRGEPCLRAGKGVRVSVSALSTASFGSPLARDELGTHNRTYLRNARWQWLGVFVRKPDGDIPGGLAGSTYGDWLFIHDLWVRADLRRRGICQELLRLAEGRARERGCHSAWLDTFSFQAPEFYPKFGYREFGRLDYPPDQQRIFFQKRLMPEG